MNQLKLYSIAFGAFRFDGNNMERAVVVETLSSSDTEFDIKASLQSRCESYFNSDNGHTGHWVELSEVSEDFLNQIRDGLI